MNVHILYMYEFPECFWTLYSVATVSTVSPNIQQPPLPHFTLWYNQGAIAHVIVPPWSGHKNKSIVFVMQHWHIVPLVLSCSDKFGLQQATEFVCQLQSALLWDAPVCPGSWPLRRGSWGLNNDHRSSTGIKPTTCGGCEITSSTVEVHTCVVVTY